MWRVGGYNISREALLAIRQGNNERVEHLVEGLVVALRQARELREAEKGGSFQTSVWDFACAVQKLARRPLGRQAGPFWDEVGCLVKEAAPSMTGREVAMFCNAYAAGAPERLTGALGVALGDRAASLVDELSPQDFTMILNGLSKANSTEAPISPQALESFASRAKRLRLDSKYPSQAPMLLTAFARLRHSTDAELHGRLFRYAQSQWDTWSPQELASLLNAFAKMGRRARASIPEEEWRSAAQRCTELLPHADVHSITLMSHGLVNVGAEPSWSSDYFDSLEEKLCKRPQLSESLSPQSLAMISHSLARQRRPEGHLREESSLRGKPRQHHAEPLTQWPFEEYATRRLRDFTPQGLALLLYASVRLRRGGRPFFTTLAQQLRRTGLDKLDAPGLAMVASASCEAIPTVGLSEPSRLLTELQFLCASSSQTMAPWQVMWVLTAFSNAAEVRADMPATAKTSQIFPSPEATRTFLSNLCQRASDVLSDPPRRSAALRLALRTAEAEGLTNDLREDLEELLLEKVPKPDTTAQ